VIEGVLQKAASVKVDLRNLQELEEELDGSREKARMKAFLYYKSCSSFILNMYCVVYYLIKFTF
jgi:hypothetical protein